MRYLLLILMFVLIGCCKENNQPGSVRIVNASDLPECDSRIKNTKDFFILEHGSNTFLYVAKYVDESRNSYMCLKRLK